MTVQNFDKVDTITKHIDGLITKSISEGKNIFEIIEFLNDKRMKFEKVIENCEKTEIRYKYLFTHNKICEKRISDFYYIENLVFKYEEYNEYDLKKLFSLIKFRDRIRKHEIKVSFE